MIKSAFPNDTASVAEGDITITYTYYKILTADIDTDPTVELDGTTSTDGVVAYYVTNSAQAAAIAALKKGDNAIFNVSFHHSIFSSSIKNRFGA